MYRVLEATVAYATLICTFYYYYYYYYRTGNRKRLGRTWSSKEISLEAVQKNSRRWSWGDVGWQTGTGILTASSNILNLSSNNIHAYFAVGSCYLRGGAWWEKFSEPKIHRLYSYISACFYSSPILYIATHSHVYMPVSYTHLTLPTNREV